MRAVGARGFLVRIDSEQQRTHGWQARRQHRDDPSRYRSRLFSDRKLGGKRTACEKALAWLRRGAR